MNAPHPPRRSSVLIVDDHPLVREGLTLLIDQQPDLFVCAQAADCASALAQARQTRPEAAVVDLSLGGESGLGLVRQLCELDPAPRILVLSMHEESSYAKRAVRAGALGYVMKRASSGQVIAALRTVLRGEFHVSEAVAAQAVDTFLWRARSQPFGTDALSDREIEVFHLISQGRENRQIAEALGLSLKTVQAHCANIKDKLGLENGTLLLREAVRWAESGG